MRRWNESEALESMILVELVLAIEEEVLMQRCNVVVVIDRDEILYYEKDVAVVVN